MRMLYLLMMIAAVWVLPTVAMFDQTFTVTSTSDDGSVGTLRWAINQANASAGTTLIDFAIPGPGVHVIQPLTPYTISPAVPNAVTIDGYTQPGSSPNTLALELGNNAIINIQIDGSLIDQSLLSGMFNIASPNSDGSSVQGLVLTRCFALLGALLLTNVSNITVRGNYIGIEPDGFTSALNNQGIVTFGVQNSTIGGTIPARYNIIAGHYFNPATAFGFVNNACVAITLSINITVAGNYINVDRSGAAVLPHTLQGISVQAAGVTIGTNAPEGRNIISGAAQAGIFIKQSDQATNPNIITIQNNYIGTNANGDAALPNELGIFYQPLPTNPPNSDVITITTNLISGNTEGIRFGDPAVLSSNNPSLAAITNNNIGINNTGTPLANRYGIRIMRSGDPLLDKIFVLDNVISGNGDGILLSELTQRITIDTNHIGTDVTNTLPLGNRVNGVQVGIMNSQATTNSIGSSSPGNTIVNNGRSGIEINRSSVSNTIDFNHIGLTATGTSFGNGLDGISIYAAALNRIGLAQGNTIAFNGHNGITILGDTALANTILNTPSYANGGLGIDLNDDGITPNDFQDPDPGPNHLQNYPIITSFDVAGAVATVTGTLNSLPNETFRIQLFGTNFIRPNITEGQFFLAEQPVITDANGDASFVFIVPFVPPLFGGVSATATLLTPLSDTSEFSLAATLVGVCRSETQISCKE